MKKEIIEKVNGSILESLEKGFIPWKPMYNDTKAFFPTNFHSKKAYRGMNVWLLLASAMVNGYKNNYWLTYKQAKMLGGSVKKGEKSKAFVIFAKNIVKNEGSDEEEKYFLYRTKAVFNYEQCERLEPLPEKTEMPTVEKIERAEKIINNFENKPTITLKEVSAPYYSPSDDEICIPPMETFSPVEGFYNDLFHECSHSVQDTRRLNMSDCLGKFPSNKYTRGELVAELTASYLSELCNIRTERVSENNATYIKFWIEKIKNDKDLFINSSSKANKVCNYILGE